MISDMTISFDEELLINKRPPCVSLKIDRVLGF